MTPPESLIDATAITPNALYYMAPNSLRHRLVRCAERPHADLRDEAAANANLALREMISTGSLRKLVTLKTGDGLQSVIIEQAGPIAYLETTTQESIFDEDSNRMLTFKTDESSEQTERIMRELARQAEGRRASQVEVDFIIEKHHAAQRMLETLEVRIPFASLLHIPSSNLAARRWYGQLLGFISAVALLRQKVKRRVGNVIVATPTDYRIAHRIMAPVLDRQYSLVPESSIELLRIAQEAYEGDQFNFTQLSEDSGLGGATTLRNRLKVLIGAGYIEQVSGRPGVMATYRVVQRPGLGQLSDLITPDELEEAIKHRKAARSS